jgi:hypothetical protein
VQLVSFLERPSKTAGHQAGHRGLSTTGNAHENEHHRFRWSCPAAHDPILIHTGYDPIQENVA